MTARPGFPPLTWLYAPGDRPEVVGKALASGADVVLIDLEDAVAPDRKEYARAATAERLTGRPPVPVHVRVNALDSPWAQADLAALATLPGVSGLRLPKVTSPSDVVRVAERAAPADGGAIALYALLETALGVEQAFAIATAHPAVRGIALGESDLRADLGVREDAGLDWSRSRVVVAARAAALPPRPSRSTRTRGIWRAWRAPVPTAARWASWAGRRSIRVSCRSSSAPTRPARRRSPWPRRS
ncbi:Citrate lyase subunit beta [Streptomyces sp. MBT84]|nr:Citrate lyase subunit beta [Streptomyces sp. MBT84]